MEDLITSDSIKVAGISLGNFGLSLTELSIIIQCFVGILSIIYLVFKIKQLRKNG